MGQCVDLQEDRSIGEYWERQFCAMAARFGHSMTPHQIGRGQSATAGCWRDNQWKMATLPDVTIWTRPGEHHEIKHKEPTRHGSVGLEDYRLRALDWFQRETGQSVYYTLHLHNLADGRNGKTNDIRHWYTINVKQMVALINSGGACRSSRMKTWCNGEVKHLLGWYWNISEFQPLERLWAP